MLVVEISFPHLSISQPQEVQVQPPQRACRVDVGFLTKGILFPHFGQCVLEKFIPQRPLPLIEVIIISKSARKISEKNNTEI